MKTLLFPLLLGLPLIASCTNSASPGTSSQSGYLGFWYEQGRAAPFGGDTTGEYLLLDTLDFTGPTEVTLTSQGNSFSPSLTISVVDSSLSGGFESPYRYGFIGDTELSMTWIPAGVRYSEGLVLFLSNDSLIGIPELNQGGTLVFLK